MGTCVSSTEPAQAPFPGAADPGWMGHSQADTTGRLMYCPAGDIDGGPPFYYWEEIAQPPVDRLALRTEARALITLPDMSFGVGPDRDKLSLGSWTWLWVDAAGPTELSQSKTERTITVTVTGRPVSVTWSPGEPVSCTVGHGDLPCGSEKVASVTCDGLGVAPTSGVTATTQPPCGHWYKWRSTAQRTGGTQRWTITGAVTWQFTWNSTEAGPAVGPETGTWTESVDLPATAIYMGELRTRIGG